LLLPLASATKFGERHTGFLLSGVQSLWREGSWHLAALVLALGVIIPLLLTVLIGSLALAVRRRRAGARLRPALHLAARLEQWSMPEVQMLGVIVAFLKLSALVETRPGAGLWCYGLAALATLVAWRSFDAPAAQRLLEPGPQGVPP
jgi:paraquat-inducible protein A